MSVWEPDDKDAAPIIKTLIGVVLFVMFLGILLVVARDAKAAVFF